MEVGDVRMLNGCRAKVIGKEHYWYKVEFIDEIPEGYQKTACVPEKLLVKVIWDQVYDLLFGRMPLGDCMTEKEIKQNEEEKKMLLGDEK